MKRPAEAGAGLPGPPRTPATDNLWPVGRAVPPSFGIRWRALLVVSLGLASFSAVASDDPVARGRALYLDGRHADGRPFTAAADDAGMVLPAAFLACVNCHGHDARGKTEAGVTTSDLRWETLAGPYEFTRPDGRTRAPYDEPRFLAAVTTGRDSSGGALDPAMPRFALSAGEAGDLIAFLRQIGQPAGEGVSDEAIRIGIALPGALSADIGSEDGRMLAAWCDGVNRRGGVFRRRLELVRIDPAADAPPADVLAVLVGDGATPSLPSACTKRRIPFLRVTAGEDDLGGRYAFALFPGIVARARVLAGHTRSPDAATPSSLALVYAPAAAESAGAAGRIVRLESSVALPPIAFAPAEADTVIRTLRAAGANRVLLIGGGGDFGELIQAGARAGWDPLWLWPESPAGTAGRRAVVARPALATDLTPEARAEYERCAGRPLPPAADRERQLALLASARLLVIALESAGRDLGREKLVETLESLPEVRTGFARPGSLSPGRHTAAVGVYLAPGGVPTPFAAEPEWVPLKD